ncbi:hypothetical protein PQE66_gp104 [Bacillus phage PBC2]|uniref:Uncharacterized protein n=1 Tax=Bacillus phage PBC2 TaxID=1675029 RepID=A0A218KBZ1_9CAUD|nr:hypothetical protein PQE66_gp104 [Bacillus phage PBC2]AKQ08419.1 hypothetical protein PBC2_104 [Bacillus phage PBC2]
MKFKKGDKVKIVRISDEVGFEKEEIKLLTNSTGVIVNVDPEYKFPYEIKFDNKEVDELEIDLWSDNELELVPEESKPNQFLYYNDTQRTVRIHPATKSHGTECNMNDILAGEMRMFYLPEGTYAWTKMWDYGGEHGLSILVSPSPLNVEEMQAKKNADRIDEIIEILKSKDGSIIDVFEALHNLKKWVN